MMGPRRERTDEYGWRLTDGTEVRAHWFMGKGLTTITVTGPRARVVAHMLRGCVCANDVHAIRAFGALGKRAHVAEVHVWNGEGWWFYARNARRFGTIMRIGEGLKWWR